VRAAEPKSPAKKNQLILPVPLMLFSTPLPGLDTDSIFPLSGITSSESEFNFCFFFKLNKQNKKKCSCCQFAGYSVFLLCFAFNVFSFRLVFFTFTVGSNVTVGRRSEFIIIFFEKKKPKHTHTLKAP